MTLRPLFFLAALALGACSSHAVAPSETAGRHAGTVAGVLRVGSGNVPRTLNPILGTQTIEAMIGRLFSDPLIAVDAHGRFVPVLAERVPTLENGDIARDGLTIRYRLRHGVRWQDGAPFTSRDVKFSFDAVMNPNNNVISRRGYDEVTRVDTPDAYTAVFHFKRPFAPAVATIFSESDSPYEIIPAHLLSRYHDLNAIPFNSQPVGTGAFRVVRWVHGDRVELTANDGYFRGKPKLRSIVVHFIPDENTEINQLRTHEIDWMFEVSPSAYKTIRTFPDIRTVLTPFNGYYGLLLNTQRPPVSDVRVRRAISMAIDKARLVRDVTFGSATVATEDLPPLEWAYNPHVPRIPYDPAGASRLLASAGYRRGPDGVLVRGGKRLSLDLFYEQSFYSSKLASVQIQAALRSLGIDVSIRPQISSLIYGVYAANGTLATGRYDIALYFWIAGIDPDNSSQFTCAALPPNGFNNAHYCSPQMDAAQRVALGTFDRPTRTRAYAQIESLLARDLPLDPFWWPRQIQAINPDFQNFDPNPVVESWDAYRWSI